jgi:hypothetical protein
MSYLFLFTFLDSPPACSRRASYLRCAAPLYTQRGEKSACGLGVSNNKKHDNKLILLLIWLSDKLLLVIKSHWVALKR